MTLDLQNLKRLCECAPKSFQEGRAFIAAAGQFLALIDEIEGLERDVQVIATQRDHAIKSNAANHARAEAAEAEAKALREALNESGKTQVYFDGFNACVQTVNSLKVHATWGPKATPNDGLELGLSSMRDSVAEAAKRIGALALSPPREGADDDAPLIVHASLLRSDAFVVEQQIKKLDDMSEAWLEEAGQVSIEADTPYERLLMNIGNVFTEASNKLSQIKLAATIVPVPPPPNTGGRTP